ncbi:MAG: translesion error-prone DNA polymerase V autoproteolytic subunit [Thermosynechococcaceae cyanobacterium MS004]|nr:translesion error-prone DNA polymerase V autoproteolytic subunit [Thermosynechococcaceae cyanobacterium MS004]
MGRGGKRPGGGRPKGSGKFGAEPTKAIRLPISLIEQIEQLQARSQESTVEDVLRPVRTTRYALPFYMVSVAAGFPAPGEDYIEGKIDLNRHLIKNPAATFLVRVTGDSMIEAGIHSGDILLVDRSLQPADQKIVIAVLNGELTVKRMHYEKGRLYLMPANPDYPAIAIEESMALQVWGVVTNVIHPV